MAGISGDLRSLAVELTRYFPDLSACFNDTAAVDRLEAVHEAAMSEVAARDRSGS
jgi:hypothetical protein